MHVAIHLSYYPPSREEMGALMGVNPDRVEVSPNSIKVEGGAAKLFGHWGWNVYLTLPRQQIATAIYRNTYDGRGLLDLAEECGLEPDEIMLGSLRSRRITLDYGSVTYYYQSIYRLE